MIRLYIIVEGRTEEIIANKLLVPHLSASGVYPTVHSENGRGRWTRWRNHIASWMRQDQKPEARFTTMFDLYALPKDFPMKSAHAAVHDTSRRIELLEQAMLDDLGDNRLVPYRTTPRRDRVHVARGRERWCRDRTVEAVIATRARVR